MLKNGGNSLKMSDKNKKTNKKNGKELLKIYELFSSHSFLFVGKDSMLFLFFDIFSLLII
jgi:hypothetical protein